MTMQVLKRPKTPYWIYLMWIGLFVAAVGALWQERRYLQCDTDLPNCPIGFWIYLVICFFIVASFGLSILGAIAVNTGIKGNRYIVEESSITLPGNGFFKNKKEVTISRSNISKVELLSPKGYSFHYLIKIYHNGKIHQVVFFPFEKEFYLDLFNKIKG